MSKADPDRGWIARLSNFAGRDREMQAALIEAAVRLTALHAAYLGMTHVQKARYFGRASPASIGEAFNSDIVLDDRQIAKAWMVRLAIDRAVSFLPQDIVCLPQAMIARRMLRRRGIASVMFFGVADGTNAAAVDTHAWVVAGPVPVAGFPQRPRYRAFAAYLPPEAAAGAKTEIGLATASAADPEARP